MKKIWIFFFILFLSGCAGRNLQRIWLSGETILPDGVLPLTGLEDYYENDEYDLILKFTNETMPEYYSVKVRGKILTIKKLIGVEDDELSLINKVSEELLSYKEIASLSEQYDMSFEDYGEYSIDDSESESYWSYSGIQYIGHGRELGDDFGILWLTIGPEDDGGFEYPAFYREGEFFYVESGEWYLNRHYHGFSGNFTTGAKKDFLTSGSYEIYRDEFESGNFLCLSDLNSLESLFYYLPMEQGLLKNFCFVPDEDYVLFSRSSNWNVVHTELFEEIRTNYTYEIEEPLEEFLEDYYFGINNLDYARYVLTGNPLSLHFYTKAELSKNFIYGNIANFGVDWGDMLFARLRYSISDEDFYRFMINYIYAWNGYIFESESWTDFFEEMAKWYEPTTIEPEFNEHELSNLTLLIELRDEVAERGNVQTYSVYLNSLGWYEN